MIYRALIASANLALAAVALSAAMVVAASDVRAQRCSADSHCQTSLRPDAQCIGDMLVVRRSICVGGSCRSQELRRETCRSSSSAPCMGDTFESVESRCDALLGRCVTRTDRAVCRKSCSCRGNVLRISTGQCTSTGCGRAVVNCKKGCTCSPEPRCLDDPPLKKPAAKEPESDAPRQHEKK